MNLEAEEHFKLAMDRIKKLASLATKGDRDMKEAIGVERAAKAMFLESLAMVMKDCFATVASKVPSAERGMADGYGSKGTIPDACFPWKGLLVAGNERPIPPDPRVAYEVLTGKALYLAALPGQKVPEFVGVVYRGQFAKGKTYQWVGESVTLTPLQIVEARWSVEEIAARVATELSIQVDGKTRATTKARKVAKAVAEAARLLEGVR